MTNTRRKKSGIEAMWDSIGPPTELASSEAPPTQEHETDSTTDELEVDIKDVTTSTADASNRAPGRPRQNAERKRTSLLLSVDSWELLDKIRYESRRKEHRATTYTELIEEAIALLATSRSISLDED